MKSQPRPNTGWLQNGGDDDRRQLRRTRRCLPAPALPFTVAIAWIWAALSLPGLALTTNDLTSVLGFTPTKLVFVATNGIPGNTGLSEASPWDLQTALSKPASAVPPGTAILLRGGTHRGPCISTVGGTSGLPVVVCSYPGEWAVLNDGGEGSLAANITASTGSCTVTGSAQWTVGAVVQIDNEQIQLYDKIGTTTWLAARGWNGTTPASHPLNARVELLGPVIDSRGNHVWWRDFEITSVRPNRSVMASYRWGGLNFNPVSHANKAINLVIHNTGHPAIGFWGPGPGGEVYGCLLWGNGIYDTTGGGSWLRGDGIYAQNQTGNVLLSDIISFRNFTLGLDAFAESNYANGFTFEGNICFDANEMANLDAATSVNPINLVVVSNNFLYQRPTQNVANLILGYVATGNTNTIISGNYIFGGAYGALIRNFNNVTLTNNCLLTTTFPIVQFERSTGFPPHNYVMDHNTYYSLNNPTPFAWGGSEYMSFSTWKSLTGYDAASTYRTSGPTNVIAVTRKNKYQAKRAHLVVFNYTGANSLAYNLTDAGLVAGDQFVIRDAQDFLGTPVLTGIFTNQLVSLPLNLTNVSPIFGEVTHFQNTHTPKEFNAFVIVGSTPGKPAPPSNLHTVSEL